MRRGRRHVDAHQGVARLGQLGDDGFETPAQQKLAHFEHRPQLLGRDDVEHIALADSDLWPIGQAARVGGLGHQMELLFRLQGETLDLDRLVDRQMILAFDRGSKRLIDRLGVVDVTLEPGLCHAVVVGDFAGHRQAGLRRDGRADSDQLHADLRGLVVDGRQRQPHRVAAANAVDVEQRETERGVAVQRLDDVLELPSARAAACGQVELVGNRRLLLAQRRRFALARCLYWFRPAR